MVLPRICLWVECGETHLDPQARKHSIAVLNIKVYVFKLNGIKLKALSS